jgi:glucosyl-3-phosphoglycerate synthase
MTDLTSILIAMREPAAALQWVALAQRLAEPKIPVHLRGLVAIPPARSLSHGALATRQWRETFETLPGLASSQAVVDHQPLAVACDEASATPGTLLLVDWAGPAEKTGGLTTDDLLERAACDVVLLCGQGWESAGPALLALRGGPNLSLGVRMAAALANARGITLLHVLDSGGRSSEVANLEIVMRDEPRIVRSVTTGGPVHESIAREAADHAVVVLGAGLRSPGVPSAPLAPTIGQVYESAGKPLALVRAARPEDLEFHAPDPRTVEEPISTRVDRWFAQNTFHSREFADVHALVALKEQQGLTISLGLPALNEEGTVGRVIRTLKTALMDDAPLLDEIILIDSNSTDRTVEIAESLGVPVFRHPDVLPEAGTVAGKGEALWKSLHVLKGDLIAWVDTDITNIHPRFVYGILGPLLKHPHLQYVKGFYQRPITVDGRVHAFGGGRVTELVVRPLFNLFYPELSGLIQPLSGEYAGRRAAFERVPFFSGYGVETGLLIDLLETYGLDAIAQTDLEVRVHHNQPLEGLSRMAFAILQVFVDRMEKRYGAQLLEQANRSMKLIVQEPQRFGLEVQTITDRERPPILRYPAYRKAHPAAADYELAPETR